MLAATAGIVVAGPLEFVQNLSGSTQFEKGRAAYGSGDYQTALRYGGHWPPKAMPWRSCGAGSGKHRRH